jgi:hypothetical protein
MGPGVPSNCSSFVVDNLASWRPTAQRVAGDSLLENKRALSGDRKQRFAVLWMGPPGFRRPVAGKFGQAIDARVGIFAEKLKEPIGRLVGRGRAKAG